MVSWVDFFYTEEGCYLLEAGLEGKEYEVYSDGSWHWVDTAEVISETIMPDYTIGGGAAMPGYTPVSYQELYDDPQTKVAVQQLKELRQYSLANMARTPWQDL